MVSRRREIYRESLREEILFAARQLFAVHGYEATSMRAIAAKVDCSPGILYHYFADKQDIMALLLHETFAKLEARLKAIRQDNDNVSARMRRGLRAYIEFGLEYPHHYSLLFMTPRTPEGNEKIMAIFQEDGNRTFDSLRTLSTEAIRAGVVRPEISDPEELAQSLWVAVHGLVSLQIACNLFPWIERSRLVDRVLDILMTGTMKA
jgi:AcrR family transcriptional regulator